MAPRGARNFLLALLATAGTAGANRHVVKGAVEAAHAERGHIAPELSPRSDSRFFGHDYTHDHAPKAPLEKDFDHPYPVVQESDAYDKDFVKDENSDDGEWKAQTEYDRLRTRVDKLKEEEKRIFAKKEELEQKLKEEKARRESIEEERRKQEEARKKAHAEAKGDMEEAKDRYGTKTANGTELGDSDTAVGVTEATENVEKELKDIEECKEQLAEAQAKLRALRKELKGAEDEERKAKGLEDSAEKSEAASEKEESEASEKVKKAEAEHGDALKVYRTEKEELEDLESRLEKARARVLKFRGSSVDQDGGVYRVEQRSLGARAGAAAPLWAALAVAAALLCATE